jgi:ADP-sugar diphosphatase
MLVEEIDGMKGKLTGLRKEGEKITLMICPLSQLWRVGARDAKTLAAVALYEGLKREGKV